jgi:hypothetical protein
MQQSLSCSDLVPTGLVIESALRDDHGGGHQSRDGYGIGVKAQSVVS